jgi:prepilin peptidase CpaA
MFGTTESGLLWGALFSALLLAGCATDIRDRRIPNLLVLVILASGVLYSVATLPLGEALLRSLAGAGLGFGIWIAFWLLGLLGAGDVKFFAAAGAWLGPQGAWRAALVAAILGGVLAIYSLIRARQLKSGVERTALALSSRSLGVLGSTDENPAEAKRHLPYGVALAGGALVAAWLPKFLA